MTTPAFLHPFARPAADAKDFVKLVRGEGVRVYDSEGNEYIDALASLWYCQIGHGRREIADAVRSQIERLEAFHCFELFTNEPAETLCERLVELSPIQHSRVFLTNSGSEAVDTAIKLARLSFRLAGEPERHIIVGRKNAYHGVTYGGLSLMGITPNATGWGPMVGSAGGQFTIEHDELSSARALFDEFGDRIAAVIAEPVIAAGGVHPPEQGYLQGLRSLCDSTGALLILDEVVCGFGRLGQWWGSEQFDVKADLITFAKGVTSGYQPLGGVIVGEKILGALQAQSDFVLRTGHTYSGHPTACVAALANIEIIEAEELARCAHEVIADHLSRELTALLEEALVSRVRGLEGIWAVEMVEGISNLRVRQSMLEAGVIARPIGDTTIAICPPLVITREELARITDALRDAIRGELQRKC